MTGEPRISTARALRPEEMASPGPTLEPTLSPPLTLDPAGAASPSVASARNAVRHRLRDGIPTLDTSPVPFNMVRLEDLSDQIPNTPTPTQTVFLCRYQDVPTQRYLNAQVCPGTLVAYVDDVATPTTPTADVDQNGNFTLPVAPTQSLRVTYAWQYLSDGSLDQFIDESRQWLREFATVDQIPDGLTPALISYASGRAVMSLAVASGHLALVRAGDSEVDWSKLTVAYQKDAEALCAKAVYERQVYYTQGPEALDPTAVAVSAPAFPPYTPLR